MEFQRGQDWVTALPVRSWVISETTFQLDTMDVSMVEINRSVYTSTRISSVQHSHPIMAAFSNKGKNWEGHVPIGEV